MEKTTQELVGRALSEMQGRQPTPITPSKQEGLRQSTGPNWQQKWLKLELRDESTRKLAQAVESFCGRWFRNGAGTRVLVLAGRSGCGKTHAMKGAHRFARAAYATAAELAHWTWPPSVQWEQWPERARAIVEGGKGIHMWDELVDAIEADLLFLDDVGAESDKYRSGETVDAMCQLLSRRERKWTLVSTNFMPEEWLTRFDGRVADRLWRNSLVCDLTDATSYSTRDAA